MEKILIGRLLRASTRTCVVGCPVGQEIPPFGALVMVPLNEQDGVYGLISEIHIEDDGLVRQLVAGDQVSETIIQDNRLNRIVPLEMNVLFIGHQNAGRISSLLPPRPPLSLDAMFACNTAEIRSFTAAQGFRYIRHILEAQELPWTDLLAAHLSQAASAQAVEARSEWLVDASKEIIRQLQDDAPRLMAALRAISEVNASGEDLSFKEN